MNDEITLWMISVHNIECISFISSLIRTNAELPINVHLCALLDLNSKLTAMKSIWWIDVHCVIRRLNTMKTTTSRCKFSRLDSISIACTSMLVDSLKEFENEIVNWCMKTENVKPYIIHTFMKWNETDRNVIYLMMRSIRRVNSAWYMRLLICFNPCKWSDPTNRLLECQKPRYLSPES